MADVAALTGDPAYQKAIDNIWNNVVSKKYYINGGIGARHQGEAFGDNYELPNHSAYCETCAAIGNVYWNHRQFLNHGEAKYYDVLERTLYNGVISGISLSGDHFFYPNPLEAHGDYTRSEWFGCACCPSNLCRFMASIPGYVYAQKDDQVYVNLYVDSHTEIQAANQTVALDQKTGYPWDGKINIAVDPQKDAQFTLKLRVPGWAQNKPVPSDLYTYIYKEDQKPGITVSLNNESVDYTIGADGYIAVNRKWNKGDVISLSLPMEIKRTITNENVEANTGRVAVERGPILYCLESIDNSEDVLKATLADDTTLEHKWEADLLGGVVTINGNNTKAIPYYAWDNRGKSNMIVWIPRNQ